MIRRLLDGLYLFAGYLAGLFLIAIFLFREPFSAHRAAAFGLIWAALALFTWSVLRRRGTAEG